MDPASPLERNTVQLSADQLTHLLEAIPMPARVVSTEGQAIAQNRAARRAHTNFRCRNTTYTGAARDLWDLPNSQTDDLGDGLLLQTYMASPGENRTEMQILARGIAHEIRNPLAAILTAISLIQDDSGLAEESKMLLDVVRKESQRMNRILNDFSSYVRPVKSQPAQFNLSETVKKVLQDLSEEGQVPPTIGIQNDLPETLAVYADETLTGRALHIIFSNALEALLDKAAKAENGDGETNLFLSSRTDATNECSVLTIEDTGSGLSAESLERAFQPFFSTRPHNTGLGLSIARSIIENAGGQVWIENVGKPHTALVEHDAPGSDPPGIDPLGSDPPGIDPPAGSLQGARVSIELPIGPLRHKLD